MNLLFIKYWFFNKSWVFILVFLFMIEIFFFIVCEGGLEFLCNNNGNCSDGVGGDGMCMCFFGYIGIFC